MTSNDSIQAVPGAPIVVSLAGLTDLGNARAENEDTLRIGDLPREWTRGPDDVRDRRPLGSGLVMGVYDGMGGMASGRPAADDAAMVVAAVLAEAPRPATEDDLRARLARGIVAANRHLYAASARIPARRGSGSTATVAALVDETLVVAQVGDSRGYLLRGCNLLQITRDDRLDAEWIRMAGHELTEEELANIPRNVITKALGAHEDIDPVITRVVLRRGDVVLLCTDGLTAMVADPAIRATLLRQRDPGVACRVLRDEATRAGGHDNITIIVARFEGEGLLPPVRSERLSF